MSFYPAGHFFKILMIFNKVRQASWGEDEFDSVSEMYK
jgi:hypothetical protein